MFLPQTRSLIVGIALIAMPVAASALEVKTYPSGRYVTGGVGAQEQAEMEKLRKQFNLRILTARKKSGDFLGDAQVAISKGASTIFQERMDGPLMLVELPPGTYQVKVTAEGQTMEQTVVIVKGDGRELYLHFD